MLNKVILYCLFFLGCGLMTGCSEIKSETEVLNEQFSDRMNNIEKYYAYYNSDTKTVNAVTVERRGNGIFVQPDGGGYSHMMYAKRIGLNNNGVETYIGQTTRSDGDIVLFPFTIESGKYIAKLNPDIDKIKIDPGYLNSSTSNNATIDASILKFNKNAAENYKQIIADLLKYFDDKGYFLSVLAAKPITEQQFLTIKEQNKALKEKELVDKQAQYNAPEPTEAEMLNAIITSSSDPDGTMTKALGLDIRGVSKQYCTSTGTNTYQCNYIMDVNADCNTNPIMCFAVNTTKNSVQTGIFERQSNGVWAFKRKEDCNSACE